MNKPFVAILMGSDSDLPSMESAFQTLNDLEIHFEARILSAHRTPEWTVNYIKDAEQRGCKVFIAAAGMAAHLAGTIAAHTIKPVIGIPMDSGGLNGFDALLSTVQMPGGVPVGCVSIGKAGAKNAALLAAQIFALTNETLANRLQSDRDSKRKHLQKADEQLQKKLQEHHNKVL